MSLKLFFDECCSTKLAKKIPEIYLEDHPDLKTRHLTECIKSGTSDEDWLQEIQREGDWIVITADRGKDPKKEKLPIICEKLGIRHISFTPSLLHDGYSAQKQALLCVWPQLVKIPRLPPGTKLALGYAIHRRGLTQLTIGRIQFHKWCVKNGINLEDI